MDLWRRAYLAEVMEEPLGEQGQEHDDGADRRHNPRRRELQRRCLSLLPAAARHLSTGPPADNDTRRSLERGARRRKQKEEELLLRE